MLDETESCSFCDAAASEPEESLEPIAAGTRLSTQTEDSTESEWRQEVSRRIDQYRARRGRPRPDDSQTGLPFREPPALQKSATDMPDRRRVRPAPRPNRIERVEIRIQPELDFSAAPDDRAHPQTALVPVASLPERRAAAALDALFLGLTYAGFLGLFRSLGGQIALEKMDAAVCFAVASLFYTLYFSLFTTLAGATIGMQLRGLVVVHLAGTLPDTRQLLWRSFGYLLSGAAFLLGFLWALWDEDRFTWQDRISHTYVTAAAPLSLFGSLGPMPHTLAHK